MRIMAGLLRTEDSIGCRKGGSVSFESLAESNGIKPAGSSKILASTNVLTAVWNAKPRRSVKQGGLRLSSCLCQQTPRVFVLRAARRAER